MSDIPQQHDMRMRITALAIALVMLAAAIGYRVYVHAPAPTLASSQASATSTNPMSGVDSDGDGIPDWQEELYGSNPYDPNSVPSTTTTAAAASSSPDVAPVTSSLAQNMLSQYLNASQNGSQPVSDPYKLGSSLANSIQAPEVQYDVYTASGTPLVASSDGNRAQYQKALQVALTPIKTLTEPEITIYGRLVAGDSSAQAKLQQTIDAYHAAQHAAEKVSVPHDALLAHIAMVNALGFYAATLQTMMDHRDDPIASIVLLKTYNEAEHNMFTSFDAIGHYFTSHATSTTS